MSTKVLAHPAREIKVKESKKDLIIDRIKTCIIVILITLCGLLVYQNQELSKENDHLVESIEQFTARLQEMPNIQNEEKFNEYLITTSSASKKGVFSKTYSTLNIKLVEIKDYINDSFEKSLEEYNTIKEKYEVLVDSYTGMQKTVKAAQKQSKKILKENKSLVKQLNSTSKELEKFQKRSELYNKYEYAITYGGKRTDLTYGHLETIEELCKKYGISPYLMTSEIIVESGGRQYATNSESTARGFGQILAGTGKFVYQNILHYGTYDHSYAFNADTNLTMMAALLGYWKNRTGSTKTAIHRYRAADYSTNEAYINKMCKVSGMTRSQLGIY